MYLSDAILILLLAERIHGTDLGVRNAGKNVVKRLPRAKRDVIYNIIAHPKPRDLLRHIAQHLDD